MARVAQAGSVIRVRGANVTPAPLSAVDVRRAAAEVVRSGGSVTVTTVTINPPATVPPRVATVHPVPPRHLPKRRTGRVAAVAGVAVLGAAAATGAVVGLTGAGWELLKTLAGLAVLVVAAAIVYALIAGKCPGIHCGGCRG